MSQNHEFGRQDSVASDKSTGSLAMDDGARRISSNDFSQLSEGDEPALPESLDGEADLIHRKEKEQNEETPPGHVIDGSLREEQNAARPPMRSNVSSFAAPTKASEAKKNEKIELAQFAKRPSLSKGLPGGSGSAIQWQSASIPDSRRPSLKWRSVTNSTSARDNDNVIIHSLPSIGRPVKKHDGARSGSLSSVVSDRSSKEEGSEEYEGETSIVEEDEVQNVERPDEKVGEAEVLSVQKEELQDEVLEKSFEKQEEEGEGEGEEELFVQEGKELEDLEDVLIKEEPLESRVEESKTELDGSQEQTYPLTKDSTALSLQGGHIKDPEAQIAIPQDQVESMLQRSTEGYGTDIVATSTDTKNIALGKICADKEELQAELEKAKTQRDEAKRQRETVQRDLQTVKDDAEKLKRKNDKLIQQLRESEDLIAARNAREPNLPALEVVEAENKRLRVAVDKKERERIDANACCENLDDQLRDSQEKLKNQEISITELCEIVYLVSRGMSQGIHIPVPQPDELAQSLAQASEIERLRIKIAQLVGTFGEDLKKWEEKNGELERQTADQGSEITRLKKAIDFQQAEFLSPHLQSPMLSPAIQMDRNGFKECYERERLERKEVEQKLIKMKNHLSHFHIQNEKLQSAFTKAQEELENLRPKADKLEKDARRWKEDSEEKKSQLVKRTRAFEISTNQQKQETLHYIKDYYNKTKDGAHWQFQGLQKKLVALEDECIALKRAFEQAKVVNARLADGVMKLRKKNKLRDAHIGKVQEAFMRGNDFPTLESDDDTASPASASMISSLAHPLDRIRRPPPIPRCHLPAAIDARKAKISAYQQELQRAREHELFSVSVKPRLFTKNRTGVRGNDIMEKVRAWKMGSSYPPRKPGWAELRRTSAWERWDGETWAKECASGKDVDILKKRELWNETWV